MRTMSKSASSLFLGLVLLAAPLGAESLWPVNANGARGLYADRKASSAGDILTVVVAESAVAQSSQSKKSERDSSIEDAVQTAVARASRTVRNLRWFEVVQTRGHIEDGRVHHYQVMLKIGFTLEEGED